MSVVLATASTVFSELNENTNITPTRMVGTTVQTISRTLFPWICGGSSVSVGFRR